MIIAWNGATGRVGSTALRYVMDRHPGVTELRLIGRSEERLQRIAAELERAAQPEGTVPGAAQPEDPAQNTAQQPAPSTPVIRLYPGCTSSADSDPLQWPGVPLEGVDIFVNTAGPGFELTPVFAGLCQRLGIDYVDPAGDVALARELRAQAVGAADQTAQATDTTDNTAQLPVGADHNPARILLAAGIQPGLSGVMVRMGAAHVGPGASVDAAAGGAQPVTPAAVKEFIDSTTNGIRFANKEWCEGKVVPSTIEQEQLSALAASYSATATAHPHTDQEIGLAAQLSAAHQVRWCNLNDAPHTAVELHKLLAGSSTVEQVLAAATVDDFGRSHYFRMEAWVTEPGATHAGLPTPARRWHTAMECVDSFDVTASVTAQLVHSLVTTPQNIPRGVWLPCELPHYAQLWENVTRDVPTAYVVPWTLSEQHAADDLDSYAPEEGEL